MYNISGFADEISPATDVQFEVLNKLGIKYFEPRGIDGKNISDLTDDEAHALRAKMDKAGISVSSIGSPIGKIQITDDFAPHMEKLAQTIRTAKILGSRYIRMFSFYIPDGRYEEYRGEVMDRMKKMTELAEKRELCCCMRMKRESTAIFRSAARIFWKALIRRACAQCSTWRISFSAERKHIRTRLTC